MIFPRDNLYFCALNILSFEEYQMLMMSVLMAQIMLSKKLLKKAMRCSRILMILRYRGFLDSMFLMMDASWSIHFRNLNILRVFFMVPRILWATSAPVFLPSRNSASTSAISEYLLQLQQKSAIYWMTEQILSLPLQVFMIIVKAETQVAMCLPYWKDILEVSLRMERVYVDRMRFKSFIFYYERRRERAGEGRYTKIMGFLGLEGVDYNWMDKYPECFSDVPPVFGKHQRKVAIAIFVGFQSFLYFFALLSLYALFTLNFTLMLTLGSISALQTLATRSQRFINYINDVLQVRRYSKGYQIIFEQPIKENDRCMFAMHPHGVLSTGLLANMNLKSGPLSTARGLSSRFMLSCPVVGLFLRLWGVESIDKHNMKSPMNSGTNIILIPGGFEEATLTNPKELRIYIKNRKGFIKYAMENNYSIYPLLYLKEHQAFWTFDHLINFRLFLNRLKLPAVFFWNLKSLVFLPPDMEYFTIVGRKINYRAYSSNQQPTAAQINKVHQEYIAELMRMYQKHKALNLNVPMKVY